MHGRISLRRAAELLRSIIGRQERWKLWRVFYKDDKTREACYLSASTLHRWLDRAWCSAEARIEGQCADVETSGQLAVDGLWARLRGGAQRAVLLVRDTARGKGPRTSHGRQPAQQKAVAD